MDRAIQMREEARECERIADLEKDQAKIDRMIETEERRRQEISRRLQVEIRRLETMRRAH